MTSLSWLHQLARKWFPRQSQHRRVKRQRRSSVRLGVELLEDRITPSTVTITSNHNWNDTGLGGSGTNGTIASGDTVIVQSGAKLTDNVANAQCASLTVNSGGTFDLSGENIAFQLTLHGTGVSGVGALINSNTTTTATDSGIVGQSGGDSFTLGGAGSLILSGAVSASGQFNVTWAGAGTLTLSGSADNSFCELTASSGNVVLDKSVGSGAHAADNLTINGANVQVGPDTDGTQVFNTLTVNSGSFAIGSLNESHQTTVLAGGSITGTTGTLTDTANPYDLRNGSVSAILAGSEGVNKTTTGPVTLSGVNTYSGGTTISGGTLQLGSSTALGSSSATVTVNTGGTLDLHSQTETVGGLSLLDGTVTSSTGVGSLTSTSTYDLESGTVGTVLAGSVGVSKTTTGTVFIDHACTFTGSTTISGGTLQITADSNLGAVPSLPTAGSLMINGGTLELFSNSVILSSNRGIALGPSTGTIDVTSGNTLTYAGIVADNGGPGSLTKTDSGTLVLSGPNTYSGGTNVSAGTLQLGSATALGATTNTVSIASGAVLDLDGQTLGNYSLTPSGTGAGAGALTNSSATAASLSGSVSNLNAFSVGGTGNITLSGAVGGHNGIFLTKVGNNTLTLSGTADNGGLGLVVNAGRVILAKTSSGGVSAVGGPGATINGGTVEMAGSGVNQIFIAASVRFTSSSGTLDLNGQSEVVSGLTGSGTVDDVSGGGSSTLTVSQGTFSGVIENTTGAVSLNKTSTSTLVLSGANTYSGGTTVSAGSLQLGSNTALGSSSATVTVNSTGTLDLDGQTVMVGGLSLLGGSVVDTAGGGSLTSASAFDLESGSASAVLAGSAGANKTSTGTVTLSGINTYSGGTTVSGGTLSISADNNLGAVPGTATPGSLVLNGGTLQATATFALSSNRGIALGPTSGTIDVTSGNTLTYAGIVADNGGPGSLTKTDSGTLVLSGISTYSGGTTVSAGTLSISADANLGAVPGTATTGSLVLNGGTLQATATFALSSNRGIALGPNSGSGGGTIDVTGSNTLTYAGIVANNSGGTGSLTKTDSGTLVLSGLNTYSGGTTVSGGTLQLGSATALGATSGAVSVASGAVLDLDGQTLGNYSLSLSGTGAGAGALTNSSATAASLSGNISNANDFSVGGTGNITLSGAVGNGNQGTLTMVGSKTLTLSGTADNGSLQLTVSAGTVILAKTSSSAIHAVGGALTINGGTVQLAGTGGDQIYDGDAFPVTVNAGGTLDLKGQTETVQGLSLLGGSVVDTAGGGILTSTVAYDLESGSASAVLAGSVGANKTTTGTMVLSGANTYSGGTTVSAGTLQLGNSTALGATSGAVSVASGAVLDLDGQTLGNYSLTLSGTGAGAGALTNSSATAASLSGNISNANDFSVGGTGNITLSGAVGGNQGTLTMVGSKTLTLSGTADNGSLQLTVSAGTVILAKTSASNVHAVGGALMINGGTVQLAGTGGDQIYNGDAFPVTVNAGGTLDLKGQTETVQGLSLLGGSVVDTASGGILTSTVAYDLESGSASAILAGSVGANKTTTGTVILSGANTYSGVTTVTGGTLSISAEANLGAVPGTATPGSLVINGGTLQATATFALSSTRGIALGPASSSGSGTIDVTSGNTLTIAGNVANNSGGIAALIKTDSGTLVLSGTNNYNQTTVSGGTLQLGSSNALGGGEVMVSNGGTLDLNGQSIANQLNLHGTGVSGVGALINSNTMQAASDSGIVGQASGDSFTLGGAGSLTLSGQVASGGPFSGAFNVTWVGTGTLTLSGTADNSFCELTASSGTVVLDKSGVSGGHAADSLTINGANVQVGPDTDGSQLFNTLTVNTGSFDIGTHHESHQATILTGGSITGTTGVLTDTAQPYDLRNGSVSAILGGSVAVNKTTTGTVILSGANIYSGGTSVSGGILQLGSPTALGSSSVTVNSGGTLDIHGQTETVAGLHLLGGSVVDTVGGGSLTSSSTFDLESGSASAVLAGSVGANKTNTGTVTLSGINTYSGVTTVSAGTLSISADANLGAIPGTATPGSLVLNGGTLLVTAGFTLSSTRGIALGPTSGSGGGTIEVGGVTLTYSGIVANNGGGIGALTTILGTVVLSGANTYSGGTTVTGGTLSISADNNLGAVPGSPTPGNLVLNGGTLQATATFALSSNRGIALTQFGGGTFDVTGSNTLTYAGIAANNGGLLTKADSGTLVLSGANTYSGGTIINSGTLQLGSPNALGPAIVMVNNGGTLDLNGQSITNQLRLLGTGFSGVGALINSNTSQAATASGDVTESLNESFTVGGAGNLNLSGSINPNFGGQFGPFDVTWAGTGTLTLSGTADNAFCELTASSGNVVLDKSGGHAADNLTINGANVQVGPDTDGAQVFGTLTINSGTFDLHGHNETVGGLSLLGGSVVDTTGGGSLTSTLAYDLESGSASAILAGSAGANKTGTGTVILSGANTYSGVTTVSGGILQLGSNTALGSSSATVTVNTGGTLDIHGQTETVGGLSLLDGSLVDTTGGGSLTSTSAYDLESGLASAILAGSVGANKTTTGTVTLSGANTYSGNTTVSAGELQVAANHALGSIAGATTVQSGATLGFATSYSALEQVFLNGGTIQADANARFAGPITLNALDSFFSALPGDTLTLAGAIAEQSAGSGAQINPGTSTGTVVLTGANTYTGLTEVVHGGLLVNGTVSSDVQADSGTTLGGNGTVNGNVTVGNGATVSAGSAPGTAGVLTVGGNFSLGTSTFVADLNSGASDQVVSYGTVALGSATATLTLNASSTFSAGSTITLVNNQSGQSSGIGTFNGLAEGATVTAGGTGQQFTISYAGGNVTLTAQALPPVTVAPSSSTLPGAIYGTAYIQATPFTASGGIGTTYTFTETGGLPTGMSLMDNGNSTAKLTGTPTQVGTFVFLVTATDSKGDTGSQAYSLTVTAGSTTQLTGPTLVVVGQPATFTVTVNNATTPYATGLVTLEDGTNVIASGNLTNGSVSFLTSTLTLGSHTLTAVYNGDSNFTGSTSALAPLNVSVVLPSFTDNFASALPNTTTSGSFSLPASTIAVNSTASFAPTGQLAILTTAGLYEQVSYTGISGNTFTGCTGGSDGVASGAAVYQQLVTTTTAPTFSLPASTIAVNSTAGFTSTGQLAVVSAGAANSTTSAQVNPGDASITVASSASFAFSGQLVINGMVISYTGNDGVNTFTGVTGVTATIPMGSMVNQATYSVVSYTGISGNSFTGCIGGSGTVNSGYAVYQQGLGSNWAVVPTTAIVSSAPPASTFILSGASAVPLNAGSTSDSLNRAVIASAPSADESISAQVTITTTSFGGFAGVFARMSNGNNQSYIGDLFSFGSGTVFAELGIENNDSVTPFTGFISIRPSGSATPFTGTLTLDVVGSSLSLFLNTGSGNTLVASATDTTLIAAGGAGIIDFDGVSVFQNFSAAFGASFTDGFQRLPSQPSLGSGWSQLGGNGFNIGSGQAVPQSSGTNVASVAGMNVGSADVVATLASLTSGTKAGVVAQWNSATQSGYELLLDPATNTVSLIKVTNGVSSSPLATASMSPLGGNNQLELEANGGTLTAYLNGKLLFTYTDLTPFTSGSAGIVSLGSGSTFSLFSVNGQ